MKTCCEVCPQFWVWLNLKIYLHTNLYFWVSHILKPSFPHYIFSFWESCRTYCLSSCRESFPLSWVELFIHRSWQFWFRSKFHFLDYITVHTAICLNLNQCPTSTLWYPSGCPLSPVVFDLAIEQWCCSFSLGYGLWDSVCEWGFELSTVCLWKCHHVCECGWIYCLRHWINVRPGKWKLEVNKKEINYNNNGYLSTHSWPWCRPAQGVPWWEDQGEVPCTSCLGALSPPDSPHSESNSSHPRPKRPNL